MIVVTEPSRTPLYLQLHDPIVVGRECEGLLVVDPLVSRRHLELAVIDGTVVITDLGSSNGTTVDGAPLNEPTQLAVGSVARAGEMTIERVPDSAAEPALGPVAAGSGQKTTFAAGASPIGSGPHKTSIEVIASSMTDEDLARAKLPADQGTLTIAFSDIESSTQRNLELGDQVWLELLGLHNTLIRRQLKRFGGTEVKNQGDGFMMSFPSARRTLMCMIAVQQDLAEHERRDLERSVRVRVGLHTGEVLVEEGDLFGTHVAIAARVASLAAGGEILVSALSKEIVAARGDVVFGLPREVELKGIGTQLVYPVDWTTQLSD